MRLFASVAVLALALATSVSAQAMSAAATEQPAAQPAPAERAAPAADKKKDGIVCHKENPTGSHFPVKVCTTAEQRKAQSTAAQHAQESMQRPSEVVPN